MNEDEIDLLALLGTCFTRFDRLTVVHTSDRIEFIHHLHALQNIVLARGSLRALRNANSKVDKL